MNKLKELIYFLNHRKTQLAIGLFLILIIIPDMVKSQEIYYNDSYVINILSSNINPLDNSYYFLNGIPAAWALTKDTERSYFTENGTVTNISIHWLSSAVVGSNEEIEMYFNYNNVNYSIQNVSNTDSGKHFSNHNLNIFIEKDNYFQIMIKTPTWATNPTGVFISGTVEILVNRSINITSLLNVTNNYNTVYQNVTNDNNLKSFLIDDQININYLNDYNYTIFLNGTYWKKIEKDDVLNIPDGSNITIFVPSPIKSNFESSYDVGKVYLQLGVMFFIGFGIVIILVIWFIRKIWSKK